MAQLRNATAPHKWRYRDTIESICKRPAMFTGDNYAEISAFLHGFDCSNRCLQGFWEWLVVKTGTGDNMPWFAIIKHFIFKPENTPEDQKIKRLWELFQAFEKDATDDAGNFDLNRIYMAFAAWRQERDLQLDLD